jgi:hypothetical protein
MRQGFSATRVGSRFVFLSAVLAAFPGLAFAGTTSSLTPTPEAGPAVAHMAPDEITLGNDQLELAWSLADGHLRPRKLTAYGKTQDLPGECFQVAFGDGRVLPASAMAIVRPPTIEKMSVDTSAVRTSDRSPGKSIAMRLRDEASGLEIEWRAILRDRSSYIRWEVELLATKDELALRKITLVDVTLPGARVAGEVQGSPIVLKNLFFGFEHPTSRSYAGTDGLRALIERVVPLRVGHPVRYSAVVGVSPAGQMRRAFLRYIEGERSRPYSQFLHYNSWYDIGYFTPYSEKDCLDVIAAYRKELVEQRGVKMSSFLFDDGWDNTATVWEFHDGFPRGFLPLKDATGAFGAGVGMWLSPWGGYGKPREQRLETGKRLGYEIDGDGYVLSGPKYFARFRDVTLDLVRRYGINQFKLDGVGSPDKTFKGSDFDSDFEAAISLIEELRQIKPDLYINLTTGTWPSPFWLRHVESIWRGGWDHEFAGVGTDRQRWITYRDADTYAGVVRQAPYYPLNSLMLHGLIYARHARNLATDPGNDFRSEIRSYFGTGTQLQEMYVSPGLLTAENWDDIAETAHWAQDNADVLIDTHWIGGDPGKLEVYGWASWAPRKGIIVLRNPSDRAQSFNADVGALFELPDGAPVKYKAKSPYRSDSSRSAILLEAGRQTRLDLVPFEVMVLEATPTGN